MLHAQQPPAQADRAAPIGGIQGRLTWFNRQGRVLGKVGKPGLYRTMTLSPDAKRLAVERTDPVSQNRDIWVIDVATGKETQFTSDPAWDAFPLWSPDGSRIVFTSNRSGVFDLYQKRLQGAGSEELFYKSAEGKGPTSWSPDGRFLLFYSIGQPTHLRLLAASGPLDRLPAPFVDARLSSITARFSPNGRWIAYASNESSTNEISVRPFDPASGVPGAPIVLSSGGGRTPLWRGDSGEIFYLGPDGSVMAQEVHTRQGFQAGTPRPLFKASPAVAFWDVTPDGKRFLMPVSEPER
jgi:Tol biopolymer transport system component